MKLPEEITLRLSPRLILWGLALIAGLWLAVRLLDVLLILAVGALLAAAMQPPVTWLARRGVPRGLGVLLLYLVLLTLLGLSAYALAPVVVSQVGQVATGSWRSGDWLEQLIARWQVTAGRYPELAPLLEWPLQWGAELAAWLAGLGRWAVSLSHLLLGGLLTLVVAYFMAADPDPPRRALLSLLPAPYRRRAYHLSGHLVRQVGRWAWSQGLLGLYIAVAFGLGLAVLGVPYAPLLALAGGLLEVIPLLGGTVTTLAAVLVSLPHSWTMALGAVVWYAVVNLVENYVLIPRLYQRTMRLHPLLVLAAFLVGGRLLGLMGVLLAVPLAAIAQAVWAHRDRVLVTSDGEEASQDPVCGMRVSPGLAAGTVVYRGQTHTFCSESCQRAFLNWPVDPVCQQKVDPDFAEQVTYRGQTYYLCSPDCATRFAEAPTSWLEPAPAGPQLEPTVMLQPQ